MFEHQSRRSFFASLSAALLALLGVQPRGTPAAPLPVPLGHGTDPLLGGELTSYSYGDEVVEVVRYSYDALDRLVEVQHSRRGVSQ